MKKFLKKLLAFISIALILILLAESIFHLLSITKISYHNINAKAQDLIPKLNSKSILVLGDSRIEWGIKPQLIENPEGGVYNLAFPGSNGFDILTYLLKKKIYPKTIIIGFTPNYWRYTNFGFDNAVFSYKNRIIENLKYYVLQRSYLYDKESIMMYFKGDKPFFIHHEYDNEGGVTVIEYGDYIKRKSFQKKMYKDWHDGFGLENYQNYIRNLTNLAMKFKGKSNIIGLYMPVSNEIFELEKENYNIADISNVYDYYYDYSSMLAYEDSVGKGENYFYDGSHLNPEFAKIFTKKFNDDLKKLTQNKGFNQ